ncbi:MAG: gluconate 2-dehydrogenase subunit 3 family protein [Chitinophagaceae bacterium]
MNRRDALKQTVLVLGYTVTVPSLLAVLAGCNNDSGTSLTWEPQFFSPSQASVISELAEAILPKTKTPGAKDLHIDQFIDRIIKQVLSAEDQQKFLKGMEAFEAEAKQVNGKSFVESAPEQRAALLTKMETETEKMPGSIWGFSLKKDAGSVPFYREVKELTLLGYFTSKEIGKEVLVYDPVPGKFAADVPLTKPGYISFE